MDKENRVKSDVLMTIRESRKMGKSDGREGLPDLSSNEPHSPFLAEIVSRGNQEIAGVTQSRSNAFEVLDNQNNSDEANLQALESELKQTSRSLDNFNMKMKAVEDEENGLNGESISSRASARRYLEGLPYLILILVTVTGEIVITQPAFTKIFEDSPLFATLATASASALSIGFAHLLGVTLKRSDDRKIRQPEWVLTSVLLSSVIILGLVFSLSNVRAQNYKAPEPIPFSTVQEGATDEATTTSEDIAVDGLTGPTSVVDPYSTGVDSSGGLSYWSALLMFLFFQLSLIVVASLASYFHFSSFLRDKKELQKEIKNLNSVEVKIVRSIALLRKKIDSYPNKIKRVSNTKKAEVDRVQYKVETRGQAYWGNNLRQRSNSPEAKSRKFNSPTCSYPEWYKELD